MPLAIYCMWRCWCFRLAFILLCSFRCILHSRPAHFGCFRLRDLRCVDLRDSFSLTDEALSTLGLLPRLERVALGLTVGARGCCRLTCRSIKALLTPQQKQYQQQQEHAQPQHEVEECIAPIKLLSLARCSEMKDFTVLANAKKTLVRPHSVLLFALHIDA